MVCDGRTKYSEMGSGGMNMGEGGGGGEREGIGRREEERNERDT